MAKILLIEDNASVREFLLSALENTPHEVTPACDGQEAIEKFESGEAFDVVISDLAMPRVDGVGFVEYLKNTSRTVPVIIISGSIFGDTRSRLEKLGVRTILEKPISPISKLFAAIEVTLSNEAPSPKKKFVLLADDDANVRMLLRKILEKNGYGVLESSSGTETLATAREKRPDIILMSSIMPGVSGKDCCIALKADPETRGIIIIMCTSKFTDDYVKECRDAGASDFIIKPFVMKKLLEKLQNAELS